MTAKPAVVGGFILGTVALVVAGILFFGGTRLFASTSRFVVFFDESIAGLDVGSPVTFHGARIGSVKSVQVHFSPAIMVARTPVYIEIEESQVVLEGTSGVANAAAHYEELVAAGLRAQLVMQSFVTGQLRVDLDFRPDTPVRLVGTIKDVSEIPTIRSELGQLRNALSELPLRTLVDSAQQAFTSVGRLSDHLDLTVDSLVGSVTRAGDAATKTLGVGEEALRQVQADASTALHDLDLMLVDARRQIDARGGELGRVLTESDRAVRRAEVLLNSLNDLAEPHSRFRADLESTVRDLAASAASLRSFADTVERNPNALLMGRSGR